MTHRVELVPPGRWRVLGRYINRRRTFGVAVFLSWAHWAVGFEFWGGKNGSILLGPLAFAAAHVRPAEEPAA